MPVTVGELTGDELREHRNTIRTWIQEELMPLAERVADRTDADAGAHRQPAIVKTLLDTNVEQEVTADLLQSFVDDNDYEPKDRELTLTKMRNAVMDLATMSLCVRAVENLTEECTFTDTTSTNLGLDEFMENKWNAMEKYLVTAMLKHMVSYMYIAAEDDEEEDLGSEDSDDEEEEDDGLVEKDSDDDSDGEGEEGSESGEPDSDAEEKMLKEAVEESDDDDEAAPAPKRAKTEE